VVEARKRNCLKIQRRIEERLHFILDIVLVPKVKLDETREET
jgi:hypothetical protein